MAEQKWGYQEEGKSFDGELNRKVLVGSLVGVVVLFLVALLVGRGVFGILLGELKAADPPPPVRAEALERRLPPQPRLQDHPELELVEMREADARVLDTYAWEDEEQGLVRVPIERAMEMVAEHGLPVWPEVDANGQPVESNPGDGQ
jgi:hypothetical protein